MSVIRYRACISYAHEDEAWAAWVQRALETFRVPGRLRSAPGHRTLPDRLAPVFRDREDLSTASDLSESLKQALEQSEAMILVCSPAAASSRWVNEEVRYFKALGRADRIFCMVVDGDPIAKSSADACYPPALSEGVQDAKREPLAADPRDFADGKRLARLKLAAGLLGVRLDELRRRDLKRRRAGQIAGAAGALLVIALAATAWRSSVSERMERDNAEQMASFMVQLGEDLRTALDLESRSRISTRMLEFYQDIDPEKLSAESRIGVGKALREAATIAQEQGRSEAALDAYTRSRDLFLSMHRELPESTEAYFELGQAEFFISNYHYERGTVEEGIANMEQYARVSRTLHDSDPGNERWVLENAYALSNLFAIKLVSGRPVGSEILEEGQEALEASELARRIMPDSADALGNYSNTLAWVADANLSVCRLPQALESRQETLDLVQKASEAEPMNNQFRLQMAYAYSGVADVEVDLGRIEDAVENLEAATSILEQLWARDPSNDLLRREYLWRYKLLVQLHVYRRDEQAVLEGLSKLEAGLEQDEFLLESHPVHVEQRLEYLMVRLLWHLQREKADQAAASLEQIEAFLEETELELQGNEAEYIRMAWIRYLGWLTSGQVQPAEVLPTLHLPDHDENALRSCGAVMAQAWRAATEGDQDSVANAIDWLHERDYRAPWFLDFLHRHGLHDHTD